MNPSLDRQLRQELDALGARGLRRSLNRSAARRPSLDFTSNDYLGLSKHPAVLAAAAEALQESGAGARSSRLLGGGSPWDEMAERSLADWLGAEAALLFPTGYQANLGLVTSLTRPEDVLLCDERIHASMIDACRLSKAARRIFAHNDLRNLERELVSAAGARRRFVLVESIYSMDGDAAPLAELNALCAEHDAWLLVDEAHAIGVCGPGGRGLSCPTEAGAYERVYARIVTGGKALGCAGGFVVGSGELRELLIHRARSFLFTTGIAPAVAASLNTAIGLARGADVEREMLRQGIERLATTLELPVPAGPILPFLVGENERAVELADQLQAEGFEVRAVRPPTVPEGTARLRLVVHTRNTEEAIVRLALQLNGQGGEAPSAPAPRRAFAIVGTDTDAGKTIASAVVARALAADGPVTYWKPVQTGDDSDTETVRALAEGAAVSFDEPVYEFPLPASPHEAAAAAESHIQFESLISAYEERLQTSAPKELLIELAGGLLVPYDDRHTQADWLARTRPRILLVARSGLGTLNHTLLTVEALRSRGLEPEALILVGPRHPSNHATLASRTRIPRVFELPIFDPLSADALEDWVQNNPMNLRSPATR